MFFNKLLASIENFKHRLIYLFRVFLNDFATIKVLKKHMDVSEVLYFNFQHNMEAFVKNAEIQEDFSSRLFTI